MKHLYLPVFLGLLIASALPAQTPAAYHLPASVTTTDYLPGKILLKVKPEYRNTCSSLGIQHPGYEKLRQAMGLYGIEKRFPNVQAPETSHNRLGQAYADLSLIYEVNFPANVPIEKAIRQLMASGLFVYAEPHFVPQLNYTPNDPMATPTDQYHLQRINAYAAWNLSKGDTSIVIGITDTGTDPTHPDLQANLKHNYADPIDGNDNDGDGYTDNFSGWDLGMQDNDPTWEANAHGVHVCGDAAAVTDNATGVAGVGFACKFLPVKIANANGSLVAAYEGIQYAADHGCTIINCSWGGPGGGQYGQDMITYATINKNCLVVVAAGNNNNDDAFYPAAYEYAFSVANTDANDAKGFTSNYGFAVDVCAPGESINSTWPGNSYQVLSGTSMASPVTAGAAGILKKQFPTYNGLQLGERLRATADNIAANNPTYPNQLGQGRINLFRALNDPAGPGVVFSQKQVVDKNDNIFISGDTLYISGRFSNYLAPTTAALSATLTALNPYSTAIDSSTIIGILNTLAFTDNSTDPFQFRLESGIPINEGLDFQLKMVDGSYVTYCWFTIYANVDYINIEINHISTTATSKGRIGFNQDNQGQGIGFNYKTMDMLYDAGLMVGNDTAHVSDRMRGFSSTISDMDFAMVNRIQHLIPSISSDFDTDARFNDANAPSPMHLDIGQKTYAWSTAPDDHYVIWEYTLKNTSATDTLKTLYAGIFADWDIDGSTYAQNRSNYDAASRMGYSYYSGSNGRYAGIQLLTSTLSPVFYATDNVSGGNGGVDITDGFNSREKYITLSTQRLSAGVAGTGSDVSNIMSAGPMVLAPGQSRTVAFALLAADSLAELKNAASQAITKYTSLLPTGIEEPIEALQFQVFPNPANDLVNVTGPLPVESLELLDAAGRLVCSAPGSRMSTIDIAPGLYLLKVNTLKNTFIKKLIISREP